MLTTFGWIYLAVFCLGLVGMGLAIRWIRKADEELFRHLEPPGRQPTDLCD